jgi:hypothetical protein
MYNLDNKLPPPQDEVRTDLWHEMTQQQLLHQRDLIVTKMATLLSMSSFGNIPPNLQGIYKALQRGMDTLDEMINKKIQGQK